MQRGPTGSFETDKTSGEAVRAFVPVPLPPVPALEFTPARNRLLERAWLACGRLDGVSVLLPSPDLFLYGYVRREAVLSSQIEGTQSSLSELLLFEVNEVSGAPVNDVVEVSNYVAAMEHGLSRLRGGFPLSSRLIREVHGRLLKHGRGADKDAGEFRRTQNWIGGTRPGNAQYVPPPPHRVAGSMSDLEKFLHDPGTPALVKAALAHVQFETIHPFLDGNGRAGRLLIALILHHEGVLRQPLLYLSLYLKQHRTEYYRLLDAVRHEGDWEAWLDFFLEGVVETATGAVDTAHRLLAVFNQDERLVASAGRSAGNAARALAVMRRRPLVSIDGIARAAGMSFPSATKGIATLEQLGIAREVTGKKRNRAFAYSRYVAILEEGAQP